MTSMGKRLLANAGSVLSTAALCKCQGRCPLCVPIYMAAQAMQAYAGQLINIEKMQQMKEDMKCTK